MTLYTFPDPRADVAARLAENASRWPAGTTHSTHFPGWGVRDWTPDQLTAPHIQHAWDGTPSQEQVRERATIRVTVWAPKVGGVQMTTAINLASLVQAVLLDSGSASVWRYTRGTGRLPGIDPDTGLPFCTFTLTAETRPSPVA